jgi:hypothetical protein
LLRYEKTRILFLESKLLLGISLVERFQQELVQGNTPSTLANFVVDVVWRKRIFIFFSHALLSKQLGLPLLGLFAQTY